MDQLKPGFRILGDEHLYDIKPKKNVRIIEQTEPGEPSLRNASLFLSIYRRQGPAKVLAPSSFHLDKHERVAISADDVDFAATPAAEITIENFIAVAAEKAASEFFATRAAAKMLR